MPQIEMQRDRHYMYSRSYMYLAEVNNAVSKCYISPHCLFICF